jgi:hypothetical protein
MRPESERLEVLNVALRGGALDGQVKGVHLDGPAAGTRIEDGPLRIVGWVVGDRVPVREVEIVAERQVVGRAAVDLARPGVAEQFPGVVGAEAAGFDLRLEPSGEGVSELQVSAILDDDSRVALATIRVDVKRDRVLSRPLG